jgi:hypothetical protein
VQHFPDLRVVVGDENARSFILSFRHKMISGFGENFSLLSHIFTEAQKVKLHVVSQFNKSLCNLCVLCVSVVNLTYENLTTETQRARRGHREN